MICKKCNEIITDGQCPICGEKPKLVNRSNEMDILMLQTQKQVTEMPEEKKPLQSENTNHKRELTKSYQQGLEVGYQNGLKDGLKEAAINGKKKNYLHNLSIKSTSVILIVFLCAIIIPSVISGQINYQKGLQMGKDSGYQQGVEDGENSKRESYEEGFKNGRAAGYNEGYQSGLSEQQAEDTENQDQRATISTRELYSKKNAKQILNGVMIIQQITNTLMNSNIEEDGQFGNGTEKAVITFQEWLGIKPTGIVDMETLAWLFYSWDHLEAFQTKYGISEISVPMDTIQPMESVPSDIPVRLERTEATSIPEENDESDVTTRPEEKTPSTEIEPSEDSDDPENREVSDDSDIPDDASSSYSINKSTEPTPTPIS